MRYSEAMQTIRKNGRRVVVRNGMRIGWRFGREVVLTGPTRFIDYTPTYEDMQADDWQVEVEE